MDACKISSWMPRKNPINKNPHPCRPNKKSFFLGQAWANGGHHHISMAAGGNIPAARKKFIDIGSEAWYDPIMTDGIDHGHMHIYLDRADRICSEAISWNKERLKNKKWIRYPKEKIIEYGDAEYWYWSNPAAAASRRGKKMMTTIIYGACVTFPILISLKRIHLMNLYNDNRFSTDAENDDIDDMFDADILLNLYYYFWWSKEAFLMKNCPGEFFQYEWYMNDKEISVCIIIYDINNNDDIYNLIMIIL